jgi:hypothetical protein
VQDIKENPSQCLKSQAIRWYNSEFHCPAKT